SAGGISDCGAMNAAPAIAATANAIFIWQVYVRIPALALRIRIPDPASRIPHPAVGCARRFSLMLRRLVVVGSVLSCAAFAAYSRPAAQAGSIDPKLFADMKWRAIGPYRGGRTKSAAGHPSQPYTFYIGVCNGGVWKTTDAGRTWKPIFDDQPTGSIGSLAIAPSDPDVLYVGSGEGLARPDLSVGDGIYKSTDAGKTWTHLGLRD